jgi:hypothetical protein
MRTRTVLLALVPTLAAAAIAPSASALATPPGSDYPWAQPGAAARATQVQPPASIPIAPAWQTMMRPGSSYVWAQPGGAGLPVSHAQPPAWVPIVPS